MAIYFSLNERARTGTVIWMSPFVFEVACRVCYQLGDRGPGISVDDQYLRMTDACVVCVAHDQIIRSGLDVLDVLDARSRVYQDLFGCICPFEDYVTLLSAALRVRGRLRDVFRPGTCRGWATQRRSAAERYDDRTPLSQS